MEKRASLGNPLSYGLAGAVITPGNTDLAGNPKAIVCLTSGDLTVVPYNNENTATIAFTGVPAGFSPPFVVRRLTAATATVAAVYDE